MYKMPYYTVTDPAEIEAFMHKHPFAMLCGVLSDKPVATHVPLQVSVRDGRFILTGHIMNGTDHHQAFLANNQVLAIFHGPHCYVSASWYPRKKRASTWNYMDVQAYGTLHFTGEAETLKILEEITNQYESAESEASFDRLPVEYVKRMARLVSGFHIEVDRIEGVFKLSQQDDKETREQIISHLIKQDDANAHAVAKEMEKRIDK